MSDPTWARAGAVIAFLAVVAILSTIGFLSWKGQGDFKEQCKAVSGYTLYDNDGDLECYRNDREIAEYGESTPK